MIAKVIALSHNLLNFLRGKRSIAGFMTSWLVARLPEGALDIVGDIHGEIDALRDLLNHLGYGHEGESDPGRKLVFVGDLVDRGPDSPGVVRLVKRLVDSGRAYAALGNHELNILLNRRREGNEWFFGERSRAPGSPPAVYADPATQRECLHLFANMPLCLERADLRVVHACWHEESVRKIAEATSVLSLFEEHRLKIESMVQAKRQAGEPEIPQEAALSHQNLNPVKVLLSGPEERTPQPYWAGGRYRHLRRSPWWKEYNGQFCIFGHYWRLGTPGRTDHLEEGKLFEPFLLNQSQGRTFCVDYSVGARWRERLTGRHGGFDTRLGCIRWPEAQLVFDNGEIMQLDFLENVIGTQTQPV
jgi:hypothetical protein